MKNNIETNMDDNDFDPDSLLGDSKEEASLPSSPWDVVTYTIGHEKTDLTYVSKLYALKMKGSYITKLVVSAQPSIVDTKPFVGTRTHTTLISVVTGGSERLMVSDQVLTGLQFHREKYSEPVMVLKFN